MKPFKIFVVFAVIFILILSVFIIGDTEITDNGRLQTGKEYFYSLYDNPSDIGEQISGETDYYPDGFSAGSLFYGGTPLLIEFDSGVLLGIEASTSFMEQFSGVIGDLYSIDYVVGAIYGYATGFRDGWGSAYYAATGLVAEFGIGFFSGFLENAGSILLYELE